MTYQPVPPDTGFLVVDCSFRPFAYQGKWIDFLITINGYTTLTQWGVHTFTMPAGVHHVDVRIGSQLPSRRPAALMVPIHPGRPTAVFYRPPLVLFGAGSLQFQPHDPTETNAKTFGYVAISTMLFLLTLTLIVVLH